MLIIVSDMAVDLLTDVLGDIIRGVLTNIDADVLVVDLNANVFAGVMTAFEFAMPCPLEECRCWAAFDCRPLVALDWDSVLQARMPPYHV